MSIMICTILPLKIIGIVICLIFTAIAVKYIIIPYGKYKIYNNNFKINLYTK